MYKRQPDGRLALRSGRLAGEWTVATSRAYFARVRSLMEDLAGELGADFRDNPLWWVGRVVTVHPLGGAPSGRHPGEGVVDADHHLARRVAEHLGQVVEGPARQGLSLIHI